MHSPLAQEIPVLKFYNTLSIRIEMYCNTSKIVSLDLKHEISKNLYSCSVCFISLFSWTILWLQGVSKSILLCKIQNEHFFVKSDKKPFWNVGFQKKTGSYIK